MSFHWLSKVQGSHVRALRRKLPDERRSITHKFSIGGEEGYITVGVYDNGGPSGWTGNQQIPYAKSIMDYIFRWLGAKFLGPEYAVTEAGDSAGTLRPTEPSSQQELAFTPPVTDAPMCSECGSIMTRNGSCYKCGNCGGTSGCS